MDFLVQSVICEQPTVYGSVACQTHLLSHHKSRDEIF